MVLFGLIRNDLEKRFVLVKKEIRIPILQDPSALRC